MPYQLYIYICIKCGARLQKCEEEEEEEEEEILFRFDGV